LSIIIFETFYHAINTQDECIQLSRLIALLTWAPSCFVYSKASNCHDSALLFHLLCIFIYLKHIDYNKMSKYIQKVEKYSFFISRSVKCVTRTTKVDNSVLPEPEIFSFITRFLLKNRVFLHLKRINHNNFSTTKKKEKI
jgi:hypothetical protein